MKDMTAEDMAEKISLHVKTFYICQQNRMCLNVRIDKGKYHTLTCDIFPLSCDASLQMQVPLVKLRLHN